MKKNIIILIFATIILSCSSDNSNNTKSNSLNPPSWIKGKWINGTGEGASGYNFSSNDWCHFFSEISTCWRNTITSSQGQLTVQETITDNSYITKFTIGGIIQTYSFIKISNTKIHVTSPDGLDFYYTKSNN